MRLIFFSLIFTLLWGVPQEVKSQTIPVYTFDQFEHLLHQQTDSLYVINFWATWCVPCVKEMPAFNEIAEKYSNDKLKVLLVSLDMPRHIESRLLPFIKKHEVKSEVILLDDPDFNSWIDKVDPSWGGGIPATLIYSKNDRSFYEQSFEFEELNNIIKTKISKL